MLLSVVRSVRYKTKDDFGENITVHLLSHTFMMALIGH